jgi:membrane associated rhomboid family serine protease
MSNLGGDLMRMMGRPSRPLTYFMGALGAIFLGFIFGGADLLVRWAVLVPARVVRGEVWEVATYALVHPSPAGLLLNLLGLWMFGTTLEKEWGTRRLFVFMAIVSVLSMQAPQAGLANTLAAMVVAFGCLYPRTPIYFLGLVPIEGRWLAVGLSALILLDGIARRAFVVTTGYAVAMGLAALLVTGLWRPRVLWSRLKLVFYRRKLKVLEGGASRPGKTPRYLN